MISPKQTIFGMAQAASQDYESRAVELAQSALKAYPKLVAIDARCAEIEAFAAAHPDRIGPP